MPYPITLHLDVATMEGQTWAARLIGSSTRYGFERQFLRTVERDLSKSGRTGTYTYMIPEPGYYETQEGRKRYGRRYWHYALDGTATEITAPELLTVFAESK